MFDFDKHLADLAAQTVLCVGDLMLDEFVYGEVSRISQEAPTPVQPEQLMDGSRTVSGFWYSTFTQRPAALGPSLDALYRMVAKGELKPVIGARYPLAEARRAHEELRARRTVGVQVLEVTP